MLTKIVTILIRIKAVLNLLILVDNLEDVQLLDLAMVCLNDENTVIRYWAVHSVTNAGVTGKLNAGGTTGLKLMSDIVERLKGLVDSSSPEILALVAKFAAEVNVVQGETLLGRIVDLRISKYADWTVEYELLDSAILRLLSEKISSTGLDRMAMAQRFAQLYSYAIQRYAMGQDLLSATQKHHLASVLVETEKSCVSELLESPQVGVKRAVEQGDYRVLLLEHNRLLGDETKPGQLPLKLNFNYGTKIIRKI